MAAQDMWAGLVGDIPGLPFAKARSQVNEALNLIYDQIFWSFQFKEANWLTPGLQFGSPTSSFSSAGTITAAINNNQVIGDATASAAWAAYVAGNNYPLITAFQLRMPNSSLYNIIAYDATTNAPFGTFTLDRPWFERASGSGLAYMVYQCYFPVPVEDFRRFLQIQDFINAAPLDFWSYSRIDLAVLDPQRVNYNQPAYVIPYEVDARPGSPTLGFFLYELWPHPLSVLPYNFAYLRRGPLLSAPTDTVPLPLTDELVMWRAKEVSYLWKEAQKGDGIERGAGADWRFLSQDAGKQYGKRFKTIADKDRDLALTYFNRFVRNSAIATTGEPFATITSGLNVGRF